MSRGHWALFAVALFVRVAACLVAGGFQASLSGDMGAYDTIARNLLTEGRYSEGTKFLARRAPAYPVFLAGVYWVVGASPARARAIQIVLDACLVWLVLAATRRLFGTTAAWAAAAWVAVEPSIALYASSILTESLCTILLAALMVLLVGRGGAAPGASRALVAGILLGLAILTRPVVLLAAPLLAIYLLLRSVTLPRGVVAATALALGAMLMVFPWTARNYRVFGEPVLVTTQGGKVFWESNNPVTAADPSRRGRNIDLKDAPGAEVYLSHSELEQDHLGYSLGIGFLRSHPGAIVPLLAAKVRLFWSPWPSDVLPFARRVADLIIYGGALPFAFIGVFQAWRRREVAALVPGILILTMFMSALIFWAGGRMRAPILPELACFVGLGVATALGRAANARPPLGGSTVDPV